MPIFGAMVLACTSAPMPMPRSPPDLTSLSATSWDRGIRWPPQTQPLSAHAGLSTPEVPFVQTDEEHVPIDLLEELVHVAFFD